MSAPNEPASGPDAAQFHQIRARWLSEDYLSVDGPSDDARWVLGYCERVADRVEQAESALATLRAQLAALPRYSYGFQPSEAELLRGKWIKAADLQLLSGKAWIKAADLDALLEALRAR